MLDGDKDKRDQDCFQEAGWTSLPLTFRFAEHLALAAAYATSPVMATVQL